MMYWQNLKKTLHKIRFLEAKISESHKKVVRLVCCCVDV